MLSREDLLNSALPSEVVDVPEMAGKVTVRGLNARDADTFQQSLIDIGEDGNAKVKADIRGMRSRLVALCLVDEQGNRMFADEEEDLIGNLPGSVVDRLFDAAQRLSGTGEQAKIVEGFAVARPTGPSSE